MSNTSATDFDQVLSQIVEAAADEPQASYVQDVNSRNIERTVLQCYALLRQELERKVKSHPDLYSKDRMERVLKQFQSVLPDIQKAIVTRVLESVSEIIRLEIRRVLRDSLSDLEDAMADPIDEELANRLLPSDMAGGLSQAKHQHSASEENAGPSTPAQKVEESHGQSHVPQEQAVPLLPVPELHSTVDVPARQHGQGPAGDSDMAQHLDNPADGEVYQSDVKVSVETHGETKQMIAFLNKLQGSSELRMLWMVGNDQGATMWLALRQPLRLKELFLQMESVIEVRDRPSRGAGSPEHVLEVVLGGSPKVAAVT